MSVLAESGSADGPDGIHGVGEQAAHPRATTQQGLVEVVVGGVAVGRVRGRPGGRVSTCTPILDT